MKHILILSLTALLTVQAQAGGAGGSWGEPTQPTTGDYTGGGGKFGGTGAGGSWGDDYSGGGGKFGGSGAGGSWNSSSSSSSSGASCTNDGWKFEYIVLKDRKSFNSLEQACRYVWSNSFLNKYGLKETRMSGGNMRGKYYRKIDVINDWSAECDIHVGYAGSNYENNIGGIGISSFSVNKYYKGKVEICDPETMPPIPNFPMPPAPNTPSGGGSNTGTGGNGNGGGSGNGGHTTNHNHTTNNYKWDITTNNHNTTNNTNHITNNHGISDDKINQLIIAIKNQNNNIDLSSIINAINTVNQSINNLSFEQIKSIEVDLTAVINAINANKYDDTQLKQKIDEVTKAINDKQTDLNEVTKRQDETNTKLDDANNKADKQISLLEEIRDLFKKQEDHTPPPITSQQSQNPLDRLKNFDISENRFSVTAQCPADRSFNILGNSFVIPMFYFCDALAMFGSIFLAMAYIYGGIIVVKAFGGS